MLELAFVGIWLLFSTGLSLAVVVFWIWMLIDCVTKEPSEGNDKLIWALVIIFVTPAIPVGAVIYYLIRRPERIRRYGS